ncbi:MAG TPA: glycosyltransferase [Anaerolineales bacterium]|nr:glycosyltransferase [Anaerolineales bacterium]HNQ94493.1 glycosyltransferase [Anaerolineales bacterium]HNS61544.1 glycosyltransferase [Anaerolineales bacterium]
MKIALITNSRIPSLTANSIQAMKVAQALMQLRHDVRMFAPAETQPVAPELLITHYGLRLSPPLELLPSISGLKRLDFIVHAQRAAQKFGAELIYTWLPQSAALGVWMKYPVVLEMHADVTGRMGAWWLRQFWNAKGKKTMTVTTSALRKALERSTSLKLENEAVLVAPNGVELERYESLPSPSEARRQLNLPDGLTVGFTGHIYPGRGAELLFELAKQMPRVNFLWVGGTPELVSFWRSKLEGERVANVTMTGFVEHSKIPLYQAAADVLLMPYSRSILASSGQDIAEVINPMKMFEYMAAGRAIVCAELPVIREVLNEGNAVFCEAGNWELVISNWRLAIESLLADESRRLALGAQARKDVERFSWVKREERVMEGI